MPSCSCCEFSVATGIWCVFWDAAVMVSAHFCFFQSFGTLKVGPRFCCFFAFSLVTGRFHTTHFSEIRIYISSAHRRGAGCSLSRARSRGIVGNLNCSGLLRNSGLPLKYSTVGAKLWSVHTQLCPTTHGAPVVSWGFFVQASPEVFLAVCREGE